MRIRFYGRLAEAIEPQVDVDTPQPCPVGDLRRRLARAYPAAAETLGRSRACIASVLVADDHQVSEPDEVEFLPPVSGG